MAALLRSDTSSSLPSRLGGDSGPTAAGDAAASGERQAIVIAARIALVSTPFELPTPHGTTLHGIFTPADLPGRRPAVLICHGFKGFQEWGFFPYVAELLAARGFHAVRFNFSGGGMRPGDALVTDLDAFRRATFGRDLDELLWLVDHIDDLDPERIDPERIDTRRIGLFGHSRGGATAVLAAAEKRNGGPIRALVTWAAVATFDRLSAAEKAEWRRRGELPIVNSRTGQELALGSEVLDDLETSGDRLDILAAAARRRAPWLIVHGRDDESVPVEEARQLAASAREPCELLEIEQAGHTFEVGHPFAGPSRELITAMNATQRWFRRHLT